MLCHIPFILLSVVDSVDSKIKGLEYGADVYIEKPFSLGYVKATVESLLENRKRAFRHFASRPALMELPCTSSPCGESRGPSSKEAISRRPWT